MNLSLIKKAMRNHSKVVKRQLARLNLILVLKCQYQLFYYWRL